MSRSRRKTPVFGLCSLRRKGDRIIANRRFRRRIKDKMHHEDFDSLPDKVKEVSDIWGWDCDGTRYINISNCSEEFQKEWNRK